MSILEKVMDFIKTNPDVKDAELFVDYSDTDKGVTYTVAPSGSLVLSREEDVLGNDTLSMQYNCVLLIRKKFFNGVNSLTNQEFIENLQFWVLEQNYNGATPQIGDNKDEEYITASNGMLLELDTKASTAVYSIQLSIQYIKKYERN